MDEQNTALTDSEALRLLAFLVTSAEGCFKEPPLYGVYRLTTAAIQLAEFWERRATSETAELLQEIVSHWQREASLLGQNQKEFKEFLMQTSVALAYEIKRQTQAEEGSDES